MISQYRKQILLNYINKDLIDLIIEYIIPPWKLIDKFHIDDKNRYTSIYCNKCQKTLLTYQKFYTYKYPIEDLGFTLCKNCWKNYKFIYVKDEYTTPCIKESCHNMVMGLNGCIKRNSYFCYDCLPKHKNDMVVMNTSRDNFKWVLRKKFGTPIEINITPISDRYIPYQLENGITKSNINRWLNDIKHLTDYLDPKFGSIKQWIPFTNEYKMPLLDFTTYLLVDCSKESNGRIAICIHTYFCADSVPWRGDWRWVDIICNSLEEYLQECVIWEFNKCPLNEQKNIYNRVKSNIKKSRSCNYEDILNLANDFGTYWYLNIEHFTYCTFKYLIDGMKRPYTI